VLFISPLTKSPRGRSEPSGANNVIHTGPWLQSPRRHRLMLGYGSTRAIESTGSRVRPMLPGLCRIRALQEKRREKERQDIRTRGNANWLICHSLAKHSNNVLRDALAQHVRASSWQIVTVAAFSRCKIWNEDGTFELLPSFLHQFV
jgi:hypothetical protein